MIPSPKMYTICLLNTKTILFQSHSLPYILNIYASLVRKWCRANGGVYSSPPVYIAKYGEPVDLNNPEITDILQSNAYSRTGEL